MACAFLLRDTTLPGSAPGGVWTQLGYSTTDDGTFDDPGGTNLPLGGDNPLLDTSGVNAGFYLLQYDDFCNPPYEVIIQVIAQGIAGQDVDVTYCINDTDVINLADLLTGETVGGTWNEAGGSDPIPSGAFDPVLGTFSIPLLGGQTGIYKISYTVDISDEAEYELVSCEACNDIAIITIHVNASFDAGIDNTILIPQSNGSFNLFDFLDGTPDIGGVWNQIEGSSAVITGGYLGTVNLDGLSGCHFRFRYSGGTGNCADESFITVNKDPNFNLSISRSGNQLTANHDPCSGITYDWYRNTGTGYTSLGLHTKTITASANGTYKVVINCNGCQQEFEYPYELLCVNNPCFTLSFDEGSDCLTVTKNGTNNSPVASDTLQWKKDGGTYQNYTAPICDCNLREFLNVVPYCSINGSKIRVGYSSFTACSGRSVSSLFWEFGNGDSGSAGGSLPSYWLEYTPAEWVAFGRTITFQIRCTTPIGTLIKKVKFTYSGSNQVNCSYVTTVHENYPKLYYKIWVKRVVTFSDGCPAVTCESFYQKDNGCTVSVNLSKCNVGSDPSFCATVYNCSGTPTYVWKLNGTVLSGETNYYCSKTHGYGVYECIVTCGDCTASDTATYQEPCSASVTISVSGSLLTANTTGCTGTITYKWYFNGTLIVGATSQTYTATQTGTYKVIITCNGCTAEASVYWTIPCTIDVTISQSGNILTANVTGCGAYSITYLWERWNGTSWVAVGTSQTYTPTQNGTYRVTATCNGCSDVAQINFNLDCNVTVTIGATGPANSKTLTAYPVGCTGTITYQWDRWNGAAWVSVGTTNSIVVTIVGTYRVTVTCGGCTAQAFYEMTGCAVTVTINVSGSVLTAIPSGCTGSVTYLWQLSINGGASWTDVGTTASITVSQTGLYKVKITCDGCTATAQVNYTQPCNTTLVLSYNPVSHIITATTSGCTGTESIQWQYSPTGSGWGYYASGVYSVLATDTGYYRCITTCDGECPLAKDIYVELDNPCDQVTLSVSPSPGKLSWDVLKKNGTPVTNYLISWRRVSDNVEIFKSAAGSFFNVNTTFPHPKSNVPMAAGIYKPYILNSDFGNNLDCLPNFTVPGVECTSGYSLNYNGPGGTYASQTVTMNVGAGTGYIKIGISTLGIADKVQVKYNGSIIFDSGNISTGSKYYMYVVPIAYVSGVNTADIIITNSNPAENTIWNLQLACCPTKTSCPITLPLVTIATEDSNCGCKFTPDLTYDKWADIWSSLCLNVTNYPSGQSSTVGGCGFSIVNSDAVCVNCSSISVQKTTGQAGFILTFSADCGTRYTALKAQINSCTTNQWFSIDIKKVSCVGDGGTGTISFFPKKGTLTFDDAARKITFTTPATNPFSNSCTGCDIIRYNKYASIYAVLNNSGSDIFVNSPYLSIVRSLILDASSNAANPYLFEDFITTECGDVRRKYKITYRDATCPCQSWELYEDTNNDGTYETLRTQAAGWTGSCI